MTQSAAPMTVAPPMAVPAQLHHVGSEFVPSLDGRTFPTLNPVSNGPIAEVARGTAQDVHAAVSAAREAFEAGPWPRLSARERAEGLRRVAALIRDNADELVALETLDIGMPISQMGGLAARAAENFDYFAGVVAELHGRSFQMGDRFLNYTIHKPVGVAALIMPWNAPLMLSTWRIAPCLAAGNTVVLKPAEWSPLTSTRLAGIISEAGIPPGTFNVIHGFGESVGAPLAAHPDVDLVCFTGETTTGQLIMAAGAPTLKRSSFELGGKSPVIVFSDCDFDRAVDAAVAQAFTMNGQRCTAGSRLLVQEEIYEPFVDAVAVRAGNVRVGDPFDPRTELGPLIRPEHHERVCGFIESAGREGATVLAGGRRPERLPDGNFLEATVIGDVTERMEVFQDEIFGPVAVAMPFRDEAEAVRLANATRYGLAAYVWTNELQRAHRVAHAVETGLCWINSHNVRDLRTPFSGVKDSGIGREGGDYSFEFYCDLEAVHVALEDNHVPRLGLGP